MKSRYLKLWLVGLACASAGLWSHVAGAAGTEAVTSFSQDAVLDKAGAIAISNTIDYDFGTTSPHEVTYILPVSYHDNQGREYRMQFHLESAKQDGQTITPDVAVTPELVHIVLPAGSGAATLRHYLLKYTLSPVILSGERQDILRLSVTGTGWPVPINHAVLKLATPTEPADNVPCYTGAQGSTTSSCTVGQEAKTTTVTSFDPLQPGDSLSIFADFPHNSFTNSLQAYEPPTSPVTWIITVVIIGLIIAVLVFFRRRRKRRSIVAAATPDYTNANETAKDQAHRN